jgi:predicted kinase
VRYVVIVSGPPASGKTTLARRLAADLALPCFTKDDVKEILFDRLGAGDRAWSRRLGVASMVLLYHLLEAEMAAGRACLVEANFRPEFANERIRPLLDRYAFHPVQIQCRAEGPTLLARFLARAGSPDRHPGHRDHLNAQELEADLLRGYYDDLDIGGTTLRVDTTDPDTIDYAGVLAAVRANVGD